MLISLTICNIVLIERLVLSAQAGLTTLTGETGAGKSVILDALGLCLGVPGDKRLIRHGADEAVVIAEFMLKPGCEAYSVLADYGVECSAHDPLILRRVLKRKGPTRGFVNDTPVSAKLLSALGRCLVEVHGQDAATSLMSPSRHRQMLDQYGRNSAALRKCSAAWQRLCQAREDYQALKQACETAQDDRDWLEAAVAELDDLTLAPGEAGRLADSRALLLQAGKMAESVSDAERAMRASGVEDGLGQAARALERILRLPELSGSSGELAVLAQGASHALERAIVEIDEAGAALSRLSVRIECDEAGLDAVEDRLALLRAAGRKHGVDPDLLMDVRAALFARLSAVRNEGEALATARQVQAEAEADWLQAAETLTRSRKAAAKRLEKAVRAELGPLGLKKVGLQIRIGPLDTGGPSGADHVEFEVETNEGAGFGPLRKIASGGERARFFLALKCVLARCGSAGTLIFDEVDQGVGGAVAAAVGERLAQLSADRQVFAITHSPQVAASGDHQWRVSKTNPKKGLGRTRIEGLDAKQREEEIARMLAGARVTPEARAAAAKLLEAPCQIQNRSAA